MATTPVTIFADIPDEVLATVDYQEILKAMRAALAMIVPVDATSLAGRPFTVEVHDFEEVED